MDRVSRSQYFRDHLSGLTPQQRHQQLVHQALQGQPGVQQGAAVLNSTETDYDALKKHHRFIRGPEDDAAQGANSWGARLARRYYSRLFKEYAIADLSRYKESKIGLRWRTQAEVVSGKGQFSCGAKGCDGSVGLCAFEINFAYQEGGQDKQALVKLCLCEDCAYRLNYSREKGKQYKKLGSSTAFDRQQQQQQRQQQERRRDRYEGRGQQRVHEEERDREQGRGRDKDRPRDRTGAAFPPPPEEQQLHQDREYDRVTRQGRDRDRVRDAGRSSDSSSGRGCKEQPGAELRLEVQRPQHVQQEGARQQPQAVTVQLQQGDAHVEQQRPSSGRKRHLTPTTDDTLQQQGATEGSSRQSKHARAEQSPAAQFKGPAAVAAAAVRAAAAAVRAAAAAAADSVSNGAGQAAVAERWQLDRQGPSGTASPDAAAGVEPAASCGPDRWELADGELDDADIECWLDSLFTAVPT